MSIDNEEDIWYNYGVNGIQGITVNNVEYVFRKNVFGDVTHIYKLNNRNLTLAAKYTYDAWGKCLVENVGKETIGDVNPIRYRGYYYDKETELYYLNARYYDPEVGRFISADSTQFLQPNTINGLNLYAYCASNPVMYVDPSGRFFITCLIVSIAIGAVIGGTINAVKAAKVGADGLGILGAFLGGAVMGGAMGAVMALGGAAGLASIGVGVVGFGLSTSAALSISLGIGIGAGMASYAIEHGMRSDLDFSPEGMILAGVSGGFQAAATFGLAFLGGRTGLFNSSLGSQYNYSLGKTVHITSVDFMKHVIGRTGRITTAQAFVYGAQVLLGNTIPRLILVSGIGALLRWIIKKGVGEK